MDSLIHSPGEIFTLDEVERVSDCMQCVCVFLLAAF